LRFYRNGYDLGIAFDRLSSDHGGLVPFVGLSNKGAQITLLKRGLKHGQGTKYCSSVLDTLVAVSTQRTFFSSLNHSFF